MYLISTILSTPILAVTNSDPYVTVSMSFCFLLNQSKDVLLSNINSPVTYLPVTLVMVKVGICKHSDKYFFSLSLGHVLGSLIFNLSIYIGPIIFLIWALIVIWHICPELVRT